MNLNQDKELLCSHVVEQDTFDSILPNATNYMRQFNLKVANGLLIIPCNVNLQDSQPNNQGYIYALNTIMSMIYQRGFTLLAIKLNN